MAKAKPRVNKSDLIRKQFDKDRKQSLIAVGKALRKKGQEVDDLLCKVVIYTYKKRLAFAKKFQNQDLPSVNVTQRALAYLNLHPRASNKTVIAALEKQGVFLYDAHLQRIRQCYNAKRPAKDNTTLVTADDLFRTMDLVRHLGGWDATYEALAAAQLIMES